MSFNPFSSASSSNSSPSLSSAASSSSASAPSMPNLLEGTSSNGGASSPILVGILVLLLAFIGFNIFEYFAKGLDAVSGILKPIFAFFISLFAQIFNVSAEGVEQTAAAAQKASTSIAKGAERSKQANNDLTSTLNSSTRRQEETNVQADDALSSIQGGGKAGWCYIGMEKGYRSCATVEASDQCMSGEIFPTQDVCVNPSLRV